MQVFDIVIHSSVAGNRHYFTRVIVVEEQRITALSECEKVITAVIVIVSLYSVNGLLRSHTVWVIAHLNSFIGSVNLLKNSSVLPLKSHIITVCQWIAVLIICDTVAVKLSELILPVSITVWISSCFKQFYRCPVSSEWIRFHSLNVAVVIINYSDIATCSGICIPYKLIKFIICIYGYLFTVFIHIFYIACVGVIITVVKHLIGTQLIADSANHIGSSITFTTVIIRILLCKYGIALVLFCCYSWHSAKIICWGFVSYAVIADKWLTFFICAWCNGLCLTVYRCLFNCIAVWIGYDVVSKTAVRWCAIFAFKRTVKCVVVIWGFTAWIINCFCNKTLLVVNHLGNFACFACDYRNIAVIIISVFKIITVCVGCFCEIAVTIIGITCNCNIAYFSWNKVIEYIIIKWIAKTVMSDFRYRAWACIGIIISGSTVLYGQYISVRIVCIISYITISVCDGCFVAVCIIRILCCTSLLICFGSYIVACAVIFRACLHIRLWLINTFR